VVLIGFAWILMLACFAGGLAVQAALMRHGRDDLSWLEEPAPNAAFIVAILGAGAVGSALALRRPSHPAGWLFLAFALSIAAAGVADDYALYGAYARPGSLPGADLVAVYGDGAFLAWVCLLSLILLVTPSGSVPSPRWRLAGWAAVVSGAVFYVAIAFRTTPLEAPLDQVRSPLVRESLAPAANAIALVAVIVAHLALVASAASLIVRARRASPEERQQLRWLLVPAIPFPFLVAGAWFAAATGRGDLLAMLGSGYLVIIPVAAALAIEKTRLYDLDRILSRAVAYTLLSALVVAVYLVVVITVGIEGGNAARESVPAAVVATTIALGLGGLTRRAIQDAVDRRFNRRAFSAMEQVRRFVREPVAGASIEQVLREASGDPSLAVFFWNDERGAYLSMDGAGGPDHAQQIELRTAEGMPSAVIRFAAAAVPRALVAALAREARLEIENERLRTAISLKLVEAQESRARIVAAQMEERQRIERDLHDGSQQRLLALAMNLRATELAGDGQAALAALPGAVREIQETVRELRELANGLHPGVLESGGLPAALQELAAKAPIPVRLQVVERRFPKEIEAAAWFISCEALTNVVKHARATAVSVHVAEEAGDLTLSIEDDGVGGADANGHGLRGIADRAEAAGGRLSVGRGALGGTSIRAVLPCGL
jgi:signal transduction histidine kinase